MKKMSKLLAISEDSMVKISWGALFTLFGIVIGGVFWLADLSAKVNEVPTIKESLINIDRNVVVLQTEVGEIKQIIKGEYNGKRHSNQ